MSIDIKYGIWDVSATEWVHRVYLTQYSCELWVKNYGIRAAMSGHKVKKYVVTEHSIKCLKSGTSSNLQILPENCCIGNVPATEEEIRNLIKALDL